ncbi:MAG: hypothetical protein ABIR70_00155 [Bryobacteraceae bacterium]
MSSRPDNPLAALQRKSTLPAASPAPPKAEWPGVGTVSPAPVPTPEPTVAVKRRRVGEPAQFWLAEEDRKLTRGLVAWLAGEGIRSTDSMAVRASLRMAKPGAGLLETYRKAALLDGWLKQ